MTNVIQNIFNNLPQSIQDEETFTEILNHKDVKIERIVSTGQVTPDGKIYDQNQDEWVILLNGSAKIWLEGKGEVELNQGDYLFIPSRQYSCDIDVLTSQICEIKWYKNPTSISYSKNESTQKSARLFYRRFIQPY